MRAHAFGQFLNALQGISIRHNPPPIQEGDVVTLDGSTVIGSVVGTDSERPGEITVLLTGDFNMPPDRPRRPPRPLIPVNPPEWRGEGVGPYHALSSSSQRQPLAPTFNRQDARLVPLNAAQPGARLPPISLVGNAARQAMQRQQVPEPPTPKEEEVPETYGRKLDL